MMDWIQTVSVLVAIFLACWHLLKAFEDSLDKVGDDLKNELRKLSYKVDELSDRVDKLQEESIRTAVWTEVLRTGLGLSASPVWAGGHPEQEAGKE